MQLRARIEARVAREKGFSLIFLESICNDPAIIAENVALKVTSGDPDYKDTSPEIAKRDFLRRISEYEKIYETITEPHLSYLRIINVGSEVTVNRINGYLSSRIAFYLMNLHLNPRSIYLSRVCFLFFHSSMTNKSVIAWRKPIQRRGKDRWGFCTFASRVAVF
jgi:6-phosphofructo-2-kinase / fructose-2,6-biphosphatase 2